MTSKYRVVQELGVGGMGKVYKGLLIGQHGFQRPIVLKQLRDDDDPAHLRLFVEEARRYALLDHENIGRIVDFERVDGRMCIILEFIDGAQVDFTGSKVEHIQRWKAVRDKIENGGAVAITLTRGGQPMQLQFKLR